MVETMDDIMHPRAQQRDAAFPFAPLDWTHAHAERTAKRDGLNMHGEHWEVVRALQEYFSRHEEGEIKLRELHDALDEHFHHKGGLKYLYTLLPGGPVAQGCRLAGLEPPVGAEDKSFGSVS